MFDCYNEQYHRDEKTDGGRSAKHKNECSGHRYRKDNRPSDLLSGNRSLILRRIIVSFSDIQTIMIPQHTMGHKGIAHVECDDLAGFRFSFHGIQYDQAPGLYHRLHGAGHYNIHSQAARCLCREYDRENDGKTESAPQKDFPHSYSVS